MTERLVERVGVGCGERPVGIVAAVAHEQAKSELKSLLPEDAKEAFGHGVRAKRSKSGAVSFDFLNMEHDHAALQ